MDVDAVFVETEETLQAVNCSTPSLKWIPAIADVFLP